MAAETILEAASSRLARAFRRAASLGPRDWLDLVEAWALRQRVAWNLRSGEYPQELVSILQCGGEASPRSNVVDGERVAHLVEIFRLASRVPLVRAECLARSLALRRFLDRRGIPAALRIGVRRGVEGIEGHAWVEWNGRVLYDAPEAVARYQPLHVGSAGDLPETIRQPA